MGTDLLLILVVVLIIVLIWRGPKMLPNVPGAINDEPDDSSATNDSSSTGDPTDKTGS